MSDSSVTMYTTPICGYCVSAKRLLQSAGIAYDEVDLSQNHELRFKLVEETGWRTVPMIYVEGQFVGGYQELQALQRQGGLAHLTTT